RFFFGDVRPGGGETHAQPGHAINFGKRARDNHVLTLLYVGQGALHVGPFDEVDVGLIHQQDGVGGQVVDQPIDIPGAGDGGSGVVGIAKVDEPAVGFIGLLGHVVDVGGIVFAQPG